MRYEDKFSYEVWNRLFECIHRMLGSNKHLTIDIYLDLHDQARVEFGSCVVINSQKLKNTMSWWIHFEGSTLGLQKFSI